MKTDIEIARETPLQPIETIAATAGIPTSELHPYGKHIAKLPHTLIDPRRVQQGHLILVTAITPTQAGIGKTTTSVGLAQGLAHLGKHAIVALREPSLGPVFGMKGGATGGGHAQVLPMEDINLHFTGDLHAITSAHNTIAALLDNHRHRHRTTPQTLHRLSWNRVLDVNDRSLRQVITGLGGTRNGIPTESGFDISAASEIMAILCLAQDQTDLRQRLDRITLGYSRDGAPFTVQDLGIGGAITVLLKDAINPNLVQTTAHTPALIHGGPFANIAHGCNSSIATCMALTYGDYGVTEAGFGADLGAEKFLNIKCRLTGLAPQATVLVVTSQALKLHGQVPLSQISQPDLAGLKLGLANLERHLQNLQSFGQSVVVGFNQFHFDVSEEIEYLRSWCAAREVKFAVNTGFAQGAPGSADLAQAVLETIHSTPSSPLRYTYDLQDSLETKIVKIATLLYGAAEVKFSPKAIQMLGHLQNTPLEQLPVCIAKTQYSFSDDPAQLGCPQGFSLTIGDLIVNTGAGFIVALAGSILRMPGLPKEPRAQQIDWVNGQIVGLD